MHPGESVSSDTPLVSVVTIFLNEERFLPEAIASVLAQTYAAWELVLVDDGSTDGSQAIARRAAAENPGRIRYIAHPDGRNHGMSASRNLGVRAARGVLIAFLDADDVYLPEKLDRQVRVLDAHPRAAMVYGATLHWRSWTGRPADRDRDQLRKLGVPPDTLVEPPSLLPLFLRHTAQTPATCGVLIRRSAFEAVDGFEEGFPGMFEDVVFFCKLCSRWPVFVESGQWDRYRQHEGSHLRRALRAGEYHPTEKNASYGLFLAWLERYLRDQRMGDPAVLDALRAEAGPYRCSLWQSLAGMVTRVRNRRP